MAEANSARAQDTAPTPREVLERAFGRMLAIDMTGFADMWAEDGVLDCPFNPPGVPRRFEGREQIRQFLIMGQQNSRLRLEAIENVVVHETTDPEVIIAELDGLGTVKTNGKPYRTKYCEVLRVRDGQIVLYRHYQEQLIEQD
jgi:uncharacterized protein